ncbi:hypothetical protein AV654_20115 [Paenibacillus elgii]|uniref:N-acetyltransferase domain-containing protein n=1 Tax=Paenibacillus elgii TaxID=189691 RepID=A0A163XH98_9BACL|nr:HAD-IIIC family phosphatase [Paenibacillus elgii]KZE77881.1 hypothetical protein AV654_20115 [Paenibacillus elgii]
MKIAILSNINVASLIREANKNYKVYTSDGYGLWVQELTNLNSNFNSFQSECTFLILDGEQLVSKSSSYEEVIKEMDELVGYIGKFADDNPDHFLFVSNLDIPIKKIQSVKAERIERKLEYYWHERLFELNKLHERLFIFDLKQIVEEVGRVHFYSPKMWYLGSMKFSRTAEAAIFKELSVIIKGLQGSRKKCLVLDLDNTLWGGIIGEDGIDGIELADFKEGARYKDFQKRLKELSDLGIILAVASKNNLSDALEAIREHKHMVLREENFVAMKINWKDKTSNILEIIGELNISPESIVFIDDNPIERAHVKETLPQIEIPEFPIDTSKLEKFVWDIYKEHFLSLSMTLEDKNKTKMYQENYARNKELQQAGSIERFLQNLKMKITIWEARQADVPRIVQLIQKTNQFNLTTRRYSEKDIFGFLSSMKYTIFVFSLSDKFGDNGVSGLVILKYLDQGIAEIDSFLMSCRIMGRRVEEQIIDYIEMSLKSKGVHSLKALYIKTLKNNPVEQLFDNLGYQFYKSDSGNKFYKINLHEINQRMGFAELEEV